MKKLVLVSSLAIIISSCATSKMIPYRVTSDPMGAQIDIKVQNAALNPYFTAGKGVCA